jgi:hypothetical protein
VQGPAGEVDESMRKIGMYAQMGIRVAGEVEDNQDLNSFVHYHAVERKFGDGCRVGLEG